MEGSFAWIDLVGLGLFAAFALLGFVRGLWWQVIRLVGITQTVPSRRTVRGLSRALLASRKAAPMFVPRCCAHNS